MWISMMAARGDLLNSNTSPFRRHVPHINHQQKGIETVSGRYISDYEDKTGSTVINLGSTHPVSRDSDIIPVRSKCQRFLRRFTSACTCAQRRAKKKEEAKKKQSDPEKDSDQEKSPRCDREKSPSGEHPSTTTNPVSSSSSCWPNLAGGSDSRLAVDTSQPFHYAWLILVSIAILYNLVIVIGRAVFWELNNLCPVVWFCLDYTCDFVYVIDTFIHAHEGYLEQGIMVRDLGKLRQNYIESRKWVTDLLSLVPTDVFFFWWSPTYCDKVVPCSCIVRANRLARLPRMLECFDRTETRTGYPNSFRICKVVFAIIVLIHWNACFYFAISYAIGFGSDNWVYNVAGPKNSSLSRQYIYSFYWSTLTLTTIGETPQPENDLEYLFVVADFLAGVLIFATIVGNIGSMISNMNVARVEFQNKMDGVKQYMAFRRVSKELEARVIKWFAYTWANKQALDEDRVLAALPDKLKAEIAIHVHLDTLKRVRIFQDCEPGLLEELVLKLRLQAYIIYIRRCKPDDDSNLVEKLCAYLLRKRGNLKVFSPGDYICRKGDVGKEMYIVKRGRLSVVADDETTVLATLSAGSVFGEVSILDIAGNKTGNRRTANVRSLGYSDLFCLAKHDLWKALSDYPEARQSLMSRGCQILRKDGLLDEEAFSRAQEEHETLKDQVDRIDNMVNNLQTRLARLQAEYNSQQNKLKQRLSKMEKKERHEGKDQRHHQFLDALPSENRHSHVRARLSFQGPSKPVVPSTSRPRFTKHSTF